MKRILLVDDSRLVLRFEETCLRSSYEVTSAASGSEALAKAVTEHPDLVLTDQNLPDLSGREIVRSLASDSRTLDIKVVIVTTASEIARLGPGLDTLEKPFTAESLLAKVVESLSGESLGWAAAEAS